MSVLIIDYGMGNLASVRRAFEECGVTAFVSSDPKELSEATHVVLPGVGAFGDGMKHLTEKGWVEPIRKTALEDKIPFLGICLGMQLMADVGRESGEDKGLGLIPGEVVRLVATSAEERIPHVGWNELHFTKEHPVFAGLESGVDVYFVHSFHFALKDASYELAKTPYCGQFVSAVGSGNLVGMQFHPEKSAKPGFQILKNFLNLGQ